MRFLFIHQNMPGQFKHLAPELARRGHEVFFATKREDIKIPGVHKLLYKLPRDPNPKIHHYLMASERAILHGQQVVRLCQALLKANKVPDLIIAHPSWGESMFVKDIFPDVPVITYGEFYFDARWADPQANEKPELALDKACRSHFAVLHILSGLVDAHTIWCPTKWQSTTFPKDVQPKIKTIFDGIDVEAAKPNPEATFTLPDGQVIKAGDEVITYVARNLEPSRGFVTFMRSLPEILKTRPKAKIIIVGGDGISYSKPPKDAANWREAMLAEVEIDPKRVFFLGQIPYNHFLKVLQVSKLHVYLTMPFVLSWSFMEAMASGCLILASDCQPVREVLEPGKNGLKTTFDDPRKLASDVFKALENDKASALRQAARETVMGRYDLKTCLEQQIVMLSEAVGRPID